MLPFHSIPFHPRSQASEKASRSDEVPVEVIETTREILGEIMTAKIEKETEEETSVEVREVTMKEKSRNWSCHL